MVGSRMVDATRAISSQYAVMWPQNSTDYGFLAMNEDNVLLADDAKLSFGCLV